MSWISQSPLLLEGADSDFYRLFIRSIGRHVAFLKAELRGGLRGQERLFAAIALAQATLCSDGYTSLRKRANRWLDEELKRQILPDGGHIGRNPRTLIELLLDLLPLRQAYSARNFTPPVELVGAIDRMMPMLRMFRHPDSSLALFNGMGVTEPDALATVLAYDDARAQANLNAPHSGYQRLEGDDLVLIMDVGAPPPPDFSQDAHAGALSFELSARGHRLVVNCGAPGQNGALREAARLTAAHSTMTIGEQSSALVPYEANGRDWMDGRIIVGPSPIRAKRHDDEEACSLEATHDGYAAPFGLLHTRRVTVFADGSRVEGVDIVQPLGARPGAGTSTTPYVFTCTRPCAPGASKTASACFWSRPAANNGRSTPAACPIGHRGKRVFRRAGPGARHAPARDQRLGRRAGAGELGVHARLTRFPLPVPAC